MRFSIELEEFWSDGEEGIEASLKDSIKSEVISKIMGKIRTTIEMQITESVKKTIDESLKTQCDRIAKEFVDNGKFTIGKDEFTVYEWIKSRFEKDSGWRSPSDQVQDMAKMWGNELKARYDKVFAAHIVDSMLKNDLLKNDSIAKLLIDNKQKD